jgi:signal transduction histidine kinase
MPEGGVLRLATRNAAGGVEIVVADSGAGVAEADAARIFEPFFSTKPSAPGLGLCVAQTIAETHGGGVYLAASRPTGAEFALRLPRRG